MKTCRDCEAVVGSDNMGLTVFYCGDTEERLIVPQLARMGRVTFHRIPEFCTRYESEPEGVEHNEIMELNDLQVIEEIDDVINGIVRLLPRVEDDIIKRDMMSFIVTLQCWAGDLEDNL
jgi:hypothetical protein